VLPVFGEASRLFGSNPWRDAHATPSNGVSSLAGGARIYSSNGVLPAPIFVTVSQARGFALHALGLVEPHGSVAAALAHHGYVQIDPINVCGRMHDLILRARVAGYREGDLMRFLHGADEDEKPHGAEIRTAFEHHLPSTGILVALEAEAWPHLRQAMRERARRTSAWSGKLTAREAELAKRILAALGERGPLGSDAVEDERRAGRSVWGAATLVKATLQKLFFHGRVLIARREGGRRLYDLPERVLPAAVLARAETESGETARWEALLKLRQRRLTALKRGELAAVADLVRPVRLEGAAAESGVMYCLREDEGLWAEVKEAAVAGRHRASEPMGGTPMPRQSTKSNGGTPMPLQGHRPRLLAPLDPLIYDRKLARVLWDFDYTWEVYTPSAKRKRGYYALPLLSGAELVGHVDPKADRKGGRLTVVGREARRGHADAGKAATAELAGFLGLRVGG
jgi:uncharacterized protein